MPTYLVTMTCNPLWDEIKGLVKLYGCPCATGTLEYTVHPDIVARVFHQKMSERIQYLKTSSVLEVVKGRIWKIEFQTRGLPHVHLLLCLT